MGPIAGIRIVGVTHSSPLLYYDYVCGCTYVMPMILLWAILIISYYVIWDILIVS